MPYKYIPNNHYFEQLQGGILVHTYYWKRMNESKEEHGVSVRHQLGVNSVAAKCMIFIVNDVPSLYLGQTDILRN